MQFLCLLAWKNSRPIIQKSLFFLYPYGRVNEWVLAILKYTERKEGSIVILCAVVLILGRGLF